MTFSAPNPSAPLLQAPSAELILLLLKQFKRLFAEQGLDLSTAQLEQLAQAGADYAPAHPAQAQMVALLRQFITESQAVLQARFQRTFAESLRLEMDQLSGWETTAEFLELANEKSNAELRISAGATLLSFFGDNTHHAELWAVLDADAGRWDVDAMLARRALAHWARVDAESPTWEKAIPR